MNNRKSIKKTESPLKKLRELAQVLPWKMKHMTKEQIIAESRKTREELWNEKYSAVRSRH